MTVLASALPVDESSKGGTFFGQPRGLFFLFMTEMWERFSFYGMRAILILYFVQELLLPGHIENVAGMAGFRVVLESILGPMSTQAFASQVFGLYAGGVYLTPMLGGWLADRVFGARRVVLAGILLMTAGHFAMAFEWSVLIALALLVLGSGCLKGNIAAQVGLLYPPGEKGGRAQGFTIFSTGINIGSTLGPLACGLMAQLYGWDYGFGTAGVLMLVSAAVYIAGSRYYPAEHVGATARTAREPLSSPQRKMVLLLVAIIMLVAFATLTYDQLANVGMIWAEEHVDRMTPFGEIPTAWFNATDPLASTLVVPFLIAFWRRQTARDRATDDIHKMAIGALILAVSSGIAALGMWSAGGAGQKVAVWYPLVSFALSGVAFMWFWPPLLAFVSHHAPPQLKAMAMAGVYLSAFLTGFGSGYLARYYEPLGPTGFWLMNVVECVVGAALILSLAPLLRRALVRLEGATEG